MTKVAAENPPQKRSFFFVFSGMRGPSFCVYFDDPPSPEMLKGRTVLYRVELTGGPWDGLGLDELAAEFRHRTEYGLALPRDPPRPAAAKAPTGVKLGERMRFKALPDHSAEHEKPPARRRRPVQEGKRRLGR